MKRLKLFWKKERKKEERMGGREKEKREVGTAGILWSWDWKAQTDNNKDDKAGK